MTEASKQINQFHLHSSADTLLQFVYARLIYGRFNLCRKCVGQLPYTYHAI